MSWELGNYQRVLLDVRLPKCPETRGWPQEKMKTMLMQFAYAKFDKQRALWYIMVFSGAVKLLDVAVLRKKFHF